MMKVPILKEGAEMADHLEDGIEEMGTVSGIFQTPNWADSPEVTRDRSGETQLTAEESAALLADAQGRY